MAQSRARLKGMVGVGAATALAIMVAVTAAARLSSDDSARLVRRTQVAACERGNVVRAYLTVNAHGRARQDRAVQLFPILDCLATTAAGKPVPLPVAAQRRYRAVTVPPLPPNQ